MRLFRLPIGAGDTDALLMRLAQAVCFMGAVFVFVAGLLKVSQWDLTEAELFGAVQQVVQTALLFFIAGSLLHPKTSVA